MNIRTILSENLKDIRESEILLAHVLNVSRSYLYAHPEDILEKKEYEEYYSYYQRHLNKEPIAYILGFQEFWSLKLKVTPDTLIPRPETELLVELALSHLKTLSTPHHVADLGTGSGAIALALAKERKDLSFFATDASMKALAIAKENADRMFIKNITFKQGSWFDALPREIKFDLIVSNPPYLASEDPAPSSFEPRDALYANSDGLASIHMLISHAKNHLKSNGYLLIEHGATQGEKVRSYFLDLGYNNVSTCQDLAGKDRVTQGCSIG